MEGNSSQERGQSETGVQEEQEEVEEEEEEEYVLLDLARISDQIHIPPNAPYVLTGLDTLNPILIIDNKIKLIGEYEETVGTCFVFNETDAAPVVHEEEGPSEANLFAGTCIMDPEQTPAKQVNAITRLDKVLKFRPFIESDNGADKQANKPSDATQDPV
ncbi:hypothetical protein CDL12_04547 [Handroanthus impetiginosus]|uniref:Transcription factor TFIIIC triple barrel domain-containing protein n=1 Tax=Handroanthus impetiginosus TaxID=429701 RepID=A0A2G9HZG4_9LAMI|nr:hypothetical protein CDL12_04547 [Handroanthus impetiginosus]